MFNTKKIYYEDIILHQKTLKGERTIPKMEIMEFAKEWDPQPYHVDEVAAKKSLFKGITASGVHILSIMSQISSKQVAKEQLMGNIQTEYRIPNPLRPNDTVRVYHTFTNKRLSNSIPNIGIIHVAITMENQQGDIIMDMKCVNLIQTRPKKILT